MTVGENSKDRVETARSERQWIEEACGGSEIAMEGLFRMHWASAHRAAYLVVRDWSASEDIAQEAFLRAVRSLDRFDRKRPFGPWLHRIVVNRSIDWCRRRAALHEVGDGEASLAAVGVETNFPDPHLRSQVFDALGVLPPEQRAVVVLRYYLAYTPGEIAELLDLNRGTVNSRMRRALDRLGQALEGRPE
jgi:RNA polymerase sigma-70 factor (ECF subfamily)